ncbi:hypothetical protein ymoll0001_37860 [Yersinia mollaretii ATCC 43969]|uniref:Uncharacterized protein n=1 Tax=Yersinia mollaretii (strain ATCC 43969 / DSM 18520 / CIP 103324 / CNY 7263 / WAIP 204) TaxID=349967 RepID=A0ABM9Y633_YERMW|nr:hypothetical protein ymoll0001_37860 [Yersinia mollaretii ATCC 43969]
MLNGRKNKSIFYQLVRFLFAGNEMKLPSIARLGTLSATSTQ